jgi:hypothetical protein
MMKSSTSPATPTALMPALAPVSRPFFGRSTGTEGPLSRADIMGLVMVNKSRVVVILLLVFGFRKVVAVVHEVVGPLHCSTRFGCCDGSEDGGDNLFEQRV